VPLSIVYTPNTNQTIALRNVNGQYASVIANYSWATVTQINQAFALNALDTISTTGNVSIGGTASVNGNLGVTGSASIVGNLNVTGTSTSLVVKASGLVNADVDVTLGNLKARIPTAGNRSLQVSTVSGTYSVYGAGTINSGTIASGLIDGATPVSVTTTPAYLKSSTNLGGAGNTEIWTIMDTGSNISWRISLIIGTSYNNNMISIERLV
jgi:hypothetical protein